MQKQKQAILRIPTAISTPLSEHFKAAHSAVTYQGWGEAEGKRIDYFMVSMTGLRVNSYDVLSETHGGVYSSDHNPIVMTAVLE